MVWENGFNRSLLCIKLIDFIEIVIVEENLIQLFV